MPPRDGRSRALVGLVVVAIMLEAGGIVPAQVVAAQPASDSLDASPPEPAGAFDSVRPTPQEDAVPPAWVPVTLDNFNRTVADGWGNASSGGTWGKWTFCGTGDASVTGQVGQISTTGWCPVFLAKAGPWQQPSWTMTAKFKTPAELDSTLSFDLMTNNLGLIPGLPFDMWVAMSFGSGVSIGADGGFGDEPSHGSRTPGTRSSGYTLGAINRGQRSGQSPTRSRPSGR